MVKSMPVTIDGVEYESQAAAAHELGISRQAIQQRAGMSGHTAKAARRAETGDPYKARSGRSHAHIVLEDRERLISALRSGMSANQAAKSCGVGLSTACYWKKKIDNE